MSFPHNVVAIWSESTRGCCPICLMELPALLIETGGMIWFERSCERHGDFRSLIASDSKEYLRLRQYVPPRLSAVSTRESGASTLLDRLESAMGCCCGPGETCGPTSSPPTCVLLLEITQACNLQCPTCYADAHGHEFMTVDAARARLDAFFQVQTSLDVLMLSGGEPTIHPRFTEMLDMALEYPITRVLVNTNGLRLEQSDALLNAIAERRSRVEVFFSFSSFRGEVHERLYGRDLRIPKTAVLNRLREARVFVTLVPTVERGVNDDELGDLYRFALSHDNVNGLNIQPVMTAGRYENEHAPAARLTLTDVLRLMEEQTSGELMQSDFVGLPCSHPDCCALTYGILDAGRTRITPLTRYLDVARYLDLFADRISFAGIIEAAAKRVWSEMAGLRSPRALRDLAILFSRAGLRDLVPLRNKPEEIGRRIFRVVVKPFMDAHTYDLQRIDQCCTKILDEQGRAVSFCEYNVVHRRRDRRGSMKSLTMAQ